MKSDPDTLVDGILGKSKPHLARALTLVENADAAGAEILGRIFPRTGKAWRIGITGPPGCGKSTLVSALGFLFRKQGFTVGIIAVDPTSPFTGGALLGDRVRMQAIASDPGIFIRSMASRGELGGLSATTQDAADLLDAFGMDFVVIETVGVGQSEVEIADASDTALVVLSPESGDGIQAMKAGLMEIADAIAVNKADREGVDRSIVELEMMLRLKEFKKGEWRPAIVKTAALSGLGIEDLAAAIAGHRAHLETSGQIEDRRRKNCIKRLNSAAQCFFLKRFWLGNSKLVDEAIDRIASFSETPSRAAERLWAETISRARGES